MPRRKPGKWSGQKRRQRIAVSLNPDMHDLLDELAAVTGKTKAGIVEELITTSAPAIQKMIVALQKFDLQPAKSFTEMADLMYQAASAAQQMGLDLDEAGKNE